MNPHHSSNPSHCSNNAKFLTHCATRELLQVFWGFFLLLLFLFFGRPKAYGVLRPGIRSELQLYQHQILNPLCQTRDRACFLVLPRCCHCATVGPLPAGVFNRIALWFYSSHRAQINSCVHTMCLFDGTNLENVPFVRKTCWPDWIMIGAQMPINKVWQS